MNLVSYLERQPRRWVLLLALLLVALIGILDSLTDPHVSFNVFYVVPVWLAAWFVGRRSALTIAVLSTAVWFAGDYATGEPDLDHVMPFLYWNAAVHLSFFLVVTWVFSSLRESRRMQRHLTDFIVHDLRSPTANISMSLNALKRNRETMDDRQQRLIDIAAGSTDRVMMLIESLLGLSRLEHARMPLKPAEVSAAELVTAATEQLAMWAADCGVTIVHEIKPDASVVYADHDLALRVLVNLLNNALKYSPPGSTVTVRTAPHDEEWIALSVTDNGPGVPQEWAHRVFDKFEQVQARQAGVASGSGLGLAFCKMAVQAQRGRIWLESDAKAGTTVTFTLPAKRR
jgi:signal transduction histidine kinase